MSNENKEKTFHEETVDEKELETVSENQADSDGDWQWDAAVPETETDEIKVDDLKTKETQEKEENEKKEDDSSDEGLCIVCGKRRGNSQSELYCEDCRKKYLRTSYGVGHIILAFVMVIVAAVSYFICATTCEISGHLAKANSYLDEKRYYDAVDECSAISEEIATVNTGIDAVFSAINKNHTTEAFFVDGNHSYKIVLEAYTDTLSIDESKMTTFITYVEQIIGTENLDKRSMQKIKGAYDFCVELVDYIGEVSEEWQTEYLYTETKTSEVKIKYDEAMAYVDKLSSDTNAKSSWNEYLRVMTAYYGKKTDDVIIGYFDNTCKSAGEYGYMYYQSYMMMLWELESYDKLIEISDEAFKININDTSSQYYAIKANIILNNFDEADRRCEEMKKASPESLDYYSTKAEILRRKSQFSDAAAICKEGIAIGTDAEIYRQQSIAYMLLDDKEAALEAAKQSYDISIQNAYSGSNVSLEVFNTAALIACICGDNDLYEEILSIFEQQNMTFEKSVQNCIKGEITFADIFMKGTGDI